MKRQGQYAIVEHTILVGIGIAIALGFLATFQALSDDIEGGATTAESRLLSKFMAANAIELAESGSNGRFTLELPEHITSNVYAIRLTDDGVEVVTTGTTELSTLYGLQNRLNVDGHVVSRAQTISLIYADGDLSLGEGQ